MNKRLSYGIWYATFGVAFLLVAVMDNSSRAFCMLLGGLTLGRAYSIFAFELD